MEGRIHSVQSLGAADGPGVRSVIFLQGCPLRCIYCHNPDTWQADGGERVQSEAVIEKILRFRPYYGTDGGVTLSGGEVLRQPEFAAALLRKCREKGLHTAIDTAGIGSEEAADRVLPYTNLVICDLKFGTEAEYKRYCGGSLASVQQFLEKVRRRGIPLWIRHVVVPGLTDSPASVQRIVQLALACGEVLQRIELLPFRKLCCVKYQQMGLPFGAADYPECTEEILRKAEQFVPPAYRG